MYCEVSILSVVNECQKVHERTFTNGLSALLNLNKVPLPAQFDKHNVLRLNQISGNLKTKANGVESLRSEIDSFSSSCWFNWNNRYNRQYVGRVTHICVNKLTISSSDNGLSPGRRQTITWTNAGILLFEHSVTNYSDILIEMHIFSFKKCIWKCLLGNGGNFASTAMC